eukprot:365209-Chlamydomonas_euryale.AAC.12
MESTIRKERRREGRQRKGGRKGWAKPRSRNNTVVYANTIKVITDDENLLPWPALSLAATYMIRWQQLESEFVAFHSKGFTASSWRGDGKFVA